jgi:hypothetical protein
MRGDPVVVCVGLGREHDVAASMLRRGNVIGKGGLSRDGHEWATEEGAA